MRKTLYFSHIFRDRASFLGRKPETHHRAPVIAGLHQGISFHLVTQAAKLRRCAIVRSSLCASLSHSGECSDGQYRTAIV